MEFVCSILEYGKWSTMREKMDMKNPWALYIVTIEGSDVEENDMFNPIESIFDQSNSLGKWARGLCGPLH